VNGQQLEQVLRDLPRRGTLVKDRPYRQVWRFEIEGKPYYLKFYPSAGVRDGFRRLFRGSPGLLEFGRLQMLQKAGVPSPRAHAFLSGFRLEGEKGDALIIEGIEPSVGLDQYLNQHELLGRPAPNHRLIARRIRELLKKLAHAGLGHSDLHLGNLVLKDDQVYLLDAYAVHKSGLQMSDLLHLAHSARQFCTTTDLLRGWKELGPGGRMPERNSSSPTLWNRFVSRIFTDDRHFGRIASEGWTGHFFKEARWPRRWSAVSRTKVTGKDWEAAWPILLKQIESDQFTVIKRRPSGDVLAGEVIIGGKPVPVVVKRPRRKYWYRYVNEIGRGMRARRAWRKAWNLVVRNIPTAWPMILMQRRTLGYATDAIIVFERVPGKTLWEMDLGAMTGEERETLMRRCGRLLRRLEQSGLAHGDAKATNWIVHEDPQRGPAPVLVDVDGIRPRMFGPVGVERLLRSLRRHRQFTDDDAERLRAGYAPYACAGSVAAVASEAAPPVRQSGQANEATP
jgi:tRNA A-37 threonylcarbamoyl transferase component Bud32